MQIGIFQTIHGCINENHLECVQKHLSLSLQMLCNSKWWSHYIKLSSILFSGPSIKLPDCRECLKSIPMSLRWMEIFIINRLNHIIHLKQFITQVPEYSQYTSQQMLRSLTEHLPYRWGRVNCEKCREAKSMNACKRPTTSTNTVNAVSKGNQIFNEHPNSVQLQSVAIIFGIFCVISFIIFANIRMG